MDIWEFEAVLDDIYDDLFESGRKGGGRSVGVHYRRENTIDHHAMTNQRERHDLIEREKNRRMMAPVYNMMSEKRNSMQF